MHHCCAIVFVPLVPQYFFLILAFDVAHLRRLLDKKKMSWIMSGHALLRNAYTLHTYHFRNVL